MTCLGLGGLLEVGESGWPEVVQEFAHDLEAIRPHGVQVTGLYALLADEPRAAQHLEVERDGLLRHLHVLRDLAHGARAVAHEREDAATIVICECSQGVAQGIGHPGIQADTCTSVNLFRLRLLRLFSAYYEPLRQPGHYRATPATAGPWDENSQHGGPPAALLGSVIEACQPAPSMRLARLTVELLSPVPVGIVTVTASVLRPGRRVRMLEAVMSADDKPVALARGWQILAQPALLDPPPPAVPPPVPESGGLPPLQGAWMDGYASSIEWRWVSGGFDVSGPSEVWTRVQIPLIGDQPLTGLQRVLIVADSANGISSVLSFKEWLFVPTALTVTLHRHAEGEWTFMRAQTILAADGIGSCQADLADSQGPLGTATQPLLIARR